MKSKNFLSKLFIICTILTSGLIFGGCGMADAAVENFYGFVGLDETGTVIAKVAQIRSSYAIVAADLLEVKRGDRLDILEDAEYEKVKWYRVRANDGDQTEGWIEAQNVITEGLLEKSKELVDTDKDIQTQAAGKLRAASNLRLTPEIDKDNLIYKLDNGSTSEITFNIVGWKYVPKQQIESDDSDAPQATATPENPDLIKAKDNGEPAKLDETYDVWYKVRLDPSVSPAPAGWIFGRQVELQIPDDIVFFQQNDRKFIAWQRLDTVNASDNKYGENISRPGSWVVLTRSNDVKTRDGVEPDFDGIVVYGYDKFKQEHYMSYRTADLWGVLPMKVEGTSDNKTFTIRLLGKSGEMEDMRFVTFKNASSTLKVTPPEGIATYEMPKK